MKKILLVIILIACCSIIILWYRNHTTRTFPARMKNTNELHSNFIFDGRKFTLYLEDFLYNDKYYRFDIKNEKFESLLYADFININSSTVHPPPHIFGMIKYYNGRDRIVLDNSDTLLAVKPVQGLLKDSL